MMPTLIVILQPLAAAPHAELGIDGTRPLAVSVHIEHSQVNIGAANFSREESVLAAEPSLKRIGALYLVFVAFWPLL